MTTDHTLTSPDSTRLVRFAWLSIGVSALVIILKFSAYWLTGSVGLLSDALESVVNIVAAAITLLALTLAIRPPDADHEYGHNKIEYLSSGAEGGMIVLAAIGIIGTSAARLINPQPIERINVGLAVSLVATGINLTAAIVLRRAGKTYRSVALEADSRHLMADVWTAVGVVIAVSLVGVTGWQWLDPMIGFVVAVQVIFSGVGLLRRSMLGLIDTALPEAEHVILIEILDSYRGQGVQYHALRTRQAGARGFVTVHLLVPGTWTIRHGHALSERIERDVRAKLPHVNLTTHIEPLDDPTSWQDVELDRPQEDKSPGIKSAS